MPSTVHNTPHTAPTPTPDQVVLTPVVHHVAPHDLGQGSARDGGGRPRGRPPMGEIPSPAVSGVLLLTL